MLAMADASGYVGASIPGLAHAARVSVDGCRAALDKFLGPDPDSRTKENEGRRIEICDGGWRLLNYETHRERASEIRHNVMSALRMRELRKRRKEAAASAAVVTDVPEQDKQLQSLPNVPQAEAEAYADSDKKKKKKDSPPPSTADVPAVFPIFPCVGSAKTWRLPDTLLEEMREAYPALDVLAEGRRAHAWCVANARNRKTATGMPRFLNAWFARAQNNGHHGANGATQPIETPQQRADRLFPKEGKPA